MNQIVIFFQVDWCVLVQDLFLQGYVIIEQDYFFFGMVQVDGCIVIVVGIIGYMFIGIEIVLVQVSVILQMVCEYFGWFIVILVDIQGQCLCYCDEMLGINSYMVYLGKCVELVCCQGYCVVGLVYD